MAAREPMGARTTINQRGASRQAKVRKKGPALGSSPAPPAEPMITVLGLWHLGCVTAACCARHFQVIGLDFDDSVVAKLNSGKAPLLEPGLDELIAAGFASKKLSFTTNTS